MAYTLTKDERIKQGEFRRIRWVRRGETPHFLLLGRQNGRDNRRIAFAIRKTTGGAVTRNRMRRLIREFFRLNKRCFEDNSDSIVRVKKMPPKLTWNYVSEELQQLLLN
jgi:ribonuclease P protein component